MKLTFTQQYGGSLALFAGAVLWFLPGIWWGGERIAFWAADEQVPRGVIAAISAVLRRGGTISPQYPLGMYLVQAIFVLPGYAALSLAQYAGISVDAYSTTILTLLHRLPSVLMAAGTVVVARAFAERIAGAAAGWFAAAFVATAGPLLFYARTSNADMGATFWTTLSLVLALPALSDGLTSRRAAALGLCAALATATKDQQFALFIGIGVLLAVTHVQDRRRSGDWEGWWRAPLSGVTVGGIAYLLLSGAVLLPTWFFQRHVPFLIYGSKDGQALPPEIRVLSGFYGSNPGTLAGYGQVAQNAATQMLAALGLPILILAVAGLAWLAMRQRRLFWLLGLPPVCLLLGIYAPVGFVLPRFLISVDVIACLCAAIGLGAAQRAKKAVWVGACSLAVAGIGWTGLRGADLTLQMLRDSRYEAARWLEQNMRAGDVIGYYGATPKLPKLPDGTRATLTFGQIYYFKDSSVATENPEFIVSIPQQVSEPVHEWIVDDKTFAGLIDGSLGYQQVFAYQTPALWPRPLLVASFVNPPVRVFARNDIVPRVTLQIELPTQD